MLFRPMPMLKSLCLSALLCLSLAAQTSGPLTDQRIIGLTRAGLHPDELARLIATAPQVSFDLSPAAERQLMQAGVTEETIKAMAARQAEVTEKELDSKCREAQNPQKRLEVLKTWDEKDPSHSVKEHLQCSVITLGELACEPNPTKPWPLEQALIYLRLVADSERFLKIDPSDWAANAYLAWYGPLIEHPPSSPEVVSEIQTSANMILRLADTVYAPNTRDSNTTEENWTQLKNQTLAIGHNALAWVDLQNKNKAAAESEYHQSLVVNPDQGTVSAQYAKLLYDDKKFPEALFEYARAAQYAGPGPALPANSRAQLMSFFNIAYEDFYGNSARIS